MLRSTKIIYRYVLILFYAILTNCCSSSKQLPKQEEKINTQQSIPKQEEKINTQQSIPKQEEDIFYQELLNKQYQNTDQELLKKTYKETGNLGVRCAVLSNMTDQTFLAKEFNYNLLDYLDTNGSSSHLMKSYIRFGAIVGLKPETILNFKYDFYEYPPKFPGDPITFIMHLKLATLDTLIIKRLGKLDVTAERELFDHDYYPSDRLTLTATKRECVGERIKIKLLKDGKVLIETTCETLFPYKTNTPWFIPAVIKNPNLFLKEILNQKYFTIEELEVLKKSKLSEIRNAVLISN